MINVGMVKIIFVVRDFLVEVDVWIILFLRILLFLNSLRMVMESIVVGIFVDIVIFVKSFR